MGTMEISTKEQCSQNGGRREFGIRHLTLRIIAEMNSFQHIVTLTKDHYNTNFI
jgi:hypothetical protein